MAIKPGTAKELVKTVVKSGCKVPLCFVGGKGIGKSEVVEQAAKELDIGFLDIRLALDTPEDVAGWPRPGENSVYYLMADWGAATFEKPSGIVFFDEINRSETSTRQALFEVMTKHSIRRKPINKDWYLVFAMNPDNGSYQVEALDSAFESRMVMLKMEPDLESWVSWASENAHKGILEFIKQNPQFLFINEVFEIKNVKPSGRSWVNVGKLESSGCLNGPWAFDAVSGLVGKEAAIRYMDWRQTKVSPISPEEIFTNYTGVKDKLLSGENDFLLASLDGVIGFVSIEKNQTTDNIKVLAQLLLDLPLEVSVGFHSKLPQSMLLGKLSELDVKTLKMLCKKLDIDLTKD